MHGGCATSCSNGKTKACNGSRDGDLRECAKRDTGNVCRRGASSAVQAFVERLTGNAEVTGSHPLIIAGQTERLGDQQLFGLFEGR